MADTEILNVLLKLENPQLFDRLERLKDKNLTVSVGVKTDGSFKAITDLQDKKIRITADAQSAIEVVKGIKASLSSIGAAKEIKLNLTGDVVKDLEKVSNLLNKLELQAKNINTVGISNSKIAQLNSNPKLLDQAVKSFSSSEFKNSAISESQLDAAIAAARARNNVANRNSGIDFFQKKSDAVQLPANEVKSFVQQKQNEAFQQQVQIANRQIQEQAAQQALRLAQNRPVGSVSNSNKEKIGGLLTELGVGLIGGTGGVLRTGGALLGGLAGSAIPGGTIIGAQVGAAFGDAAAKSLEAVAAALDVVSKAGQEFQNTIVALTGILQANTDVIGADGKKLSEVDAVKFNTQEARRLQKSARSGLLPLGIGGDAEAVLVQGFVSGLSQRGIVLNAEQTKVVTERLGAAIVTLTPQILKATNQERKDVEDIGANSPNAGRTTLGVALKKIVPDLFRQLATGDEVVRATERLQQFVTAIKNSDQGSVQLLRVSGAIQKLITNIGDTKIQGDQSGNKALADALDNPNLDNATETLGAALGVLNSGALKLAAVGITLLGDKLSAFAKSLRAIFPELDRIINGPEAIKAKNKAKSELVATGGFTALGIEDPTGEFNKKLIQEPLERLQNIRRLEQKLAEIQNANQEDSLSKFILPLVDEEISTLKNAQRNKLATLDTSNFPGRSAAAASTIDFSNQQIAAARSGIAVAQGDLANAQKSGNVQDQSRAVAAINRFNQEIEEATKAIGLANKEVQNIALDQRKAIQTVRNATEGLANAEKDQALKLRDLTRSLQEATDAVTTFASKADAAFASKEEQGLQAAKELRDAGGPDLIGDLEYKIAQAKLRSTSAKFNEFSAEVGLGISAPQEESGLKLSKLGTPFSNSIDNLGAKLNDSVEAVGNEIERLPRVIRDLKEAFEDLIARTKQLFNSNNIPTNQPGIPPLNYPGGTSPATPGGVGGPGGPPGTNPTGGGSSSGGVLPPASGGAIGGGNLSRGSRPNRLSGRKPLRGGSSSSGGDFDSDTKTGSSEYEENLNRIRGSGRRPDGSSRDDLPDPLDFLREADPTGPLGFLPDPRDRAEEPFNLDGLTRRLGGGLSGGISNDLDALKSGISNVGAGSLLETQKSSAAQDYGNIFNIDKLMELTDPSNLTIHDFGRIQKSLGAAYDPQDEDTEDFNEEKFPEARKYIKDLLMENSRRLPANLFEKFDRMDEVRRNPQAFSIDDAERYIQTRDPKQRIEARFGNNLREPQSAESNRRSAGFIKLRNELPFLLPDQREDGYDITGRPPKKGDSNYLFPGMQDNPESTEEYYRTHYYGEVRPSEKYSYINPKPEEESKPEFEFKPLFERLGNPLFDIGNGFSSSIDPNMLKGGVDTTSLFGSNSQEELESSLPKDILPSRDPAPLPKLRGAAASNPTWKGSKDAWKVDDYAKKQFGVDCLSQEQRKILNNYSTGMMLDAVRLKTSDGTIEGLVGNNPLFEDGESMKRSVFPLNDNPINFSDSLIARPSLPSRAYNPILREGLNEGLGNKADAKTNAVLEDVVGGFLDADVDGLKKQNRAPASGLKNGLFSGGLFGLSQESLKQDQGGLEATINTVADKIIQGVGNAFRSTINGI